MEILKKSKETEGTKEVKEAGGDKNKKYKILLLTNRDSDNIGDQVIEACDIGIISAVMKNLGIEKSDFEIESRAASIVSQRYIATRDPQLLKSARKSIKEADVVVFGGAPMFNFLYQIFYERTAVTLELAKEYNTPVIFSAIGVEGYDDNNAKCQRLKKTLNFDCVKQITTRDDFAALQKYVENKKTVIDKVSDPAVFTSKVFENFRSKKSEKKKKVGIFILRANGFVDNKINFTKEDSAAFWAGLVHNLEKNGYDYELLTSGHFGDEAYLDYLIRNYRIDGKKCVFNMNLPEQLVRRISSYDAVVSCRLHPSIISFSLDVPSLGIVWNSKVEGFYDSIGYSDRVLRVDNISAEAVVKKIGEIIDQGVKKDEEYLVSVYRYLFDGLRKTLCPDKEAEPFSYEEILNNIPAYQGTSAKDKEEKLKRKFRRTYKTYNEVHEKSRQYQKTIEELKAGTGGNRISEYRIYYHSGAPAGEVSQNYAKADGKIITTGKGAWEYQCSAPVLNKAPVRLKENCFVREGYRFAGWNGRISVKKGTFWFCNDGEFHTSAEILAKRDLEKYVFGNCEAVYSLPIDEKLAGSALVMEAIWERC
ncbi:MAG: polysaccharide pyruvyl transferase family protein [Blautia sp.]